MSPIGGLLTVSNPSKATTSATLFLGIPSWMVNLLLTIKKQQQTLSQHLFDEVMSGPNEPSSEWVARFLIGHNDLMHADILSVLGVKEVRGGKNDMKMIRMTRVTP